MDWIAIIRFFLAALVVLLLPGAALLAWLQREAPAEPLTRRDPVAWLADSVATSIALTALAGLWLFVAGWRLSGPAVVTVYAACLLALAARWVKLGRVLHSPSLRGWLAGFLVLAFLTILLAWRLYQARDLVLPAWVDSVQHALIVRKILAYGGVPADFAPYLPVPFYYHYGFHLIAALFAFWSGASADQSLLWFGQVINALVSISVYRAAIAVQEQAQGLEASQKTVIPAAWKAALAALLVEFAMQMPAYYLTWGRYTLLTGLLLLGPALAAALALWREPRRWDAWILLTLFVAGAALTHYFVLLLVGLFLFVLGLFWAASRLRTALVHGSGGEGAILRLVSAALVGILLVLPWVIRVYTYDRQDATVKLVSPVDASEAQANSAANYLQYLSYLLGPRRSHILLGASVLGLLLALKGPVHRRLAAWSALLALLSLPWGLRLGPFRPDHFAIILFFPAALLLAGLFAAGASILGDKLRPWVGRAALLVAGGLLIVWGARETRSILNPSTVFTTSADVAALDWVNLHTPVDARFYINNTPWQWDVYRGVDGGYWLLPYTGRSSLVPPISYAWGSQDYNRQIRDWAVRSEKLKGCTTDFWNLVREAGLTYLYIHEGVGNLQPKALAGCSGLSVVYQQDGVWIYSIASRP